MRLSILSTMAEAPWGGSEELWAGLAFAALESGWTVRALLPFFKDSHPKRAGLARAGAELTPWVQQDVLKWTSGALKDPAANPYRSLLEPKPDLVVISHGGLMDIINGHVGLLSDLWASGVPYVVIIQANTEGYWPNDTQRSVMRRYFAGALRTVFVSRENMEIARRQLAAPLENAVVWQQPVNLASAKPVKWPSEPVLTMASVARIDVLPKGHDFLMEILSRPVWREREWKLNLYGAGPSAQLVHESAVLGGIRDRVCFNGQVADIAELWRRNHVLLMPSRLEGTPLAMLEALCCGRPALVTDVGGSADWIIDGETGFVAAAARLEIVADALERLWGARSRLAKMGDAAARFMASSFDPQPGTALFKHVVACLGRRPRSVAARSPVPGLSVIFVGGGEAKARAVSEHFGDQTDVEFLLVDSVASAAERELGGLVLVAAGTKSPAAAANAGMAAAQGKYALIVTAAESVVPDYIESVLGAIRAHATSGHWCFEPGETPRLAVFPSDDWRSHGGFPTNTRGEFLAWFWQRLRSRGIEAKRVAATGVKAADTRPSFPCVTVVVTCYNYAQYLERCVDSVLAQTYPACEVVIVDDGSTDASPQIADAIAEKHPDAVRVVHQANSGQPAISRNAGIKAARGELILPLDADDWIAPTMVEACAAALQAAEADVAYTDSVYCHELGQIRMYFGGEFSVKALREQNQLNCCSMFRKKVWDVVGGYRTNVRGYEDWDFWLAAAAAGFRGTRVAQPLFFYRAKQTGVFAQTTGRDKLLRAHIRLNNPTCYSEAERADATKLVAAEEKPAPGSSGVAAKADQRGDLKQRVVETYAAGNLDACIAACAEALKSEASDEDLLLVYADALTKKGRLREAAGVLDRLIALQPNVQEHRQLRAAVGAAIEADGAAGKGSPKDDPNPLAAIQGKRILVYSDDPGHGGAAHYNHTLMLGLTAAGAQVVSAQPKEDTPLLREQARAGIKHCWLAYDPVQSFTRSFTDATDAERIVREERPDLVFFSDCCAVSNIAAKQVAVKAGIPYVLICHSEAGYLAERFPQVLGAVAELLARAANVIGVSESSRSVLRRYFGLAADKGVVIYSGRPAKYFAPKDGAARDRIRRELGLASDAVLSVTVARHDAAKGFQFQLEAIRRLHVENRLGPLYFAWAGEGDARDQLAALVAKHHLESRVRLLGYRWDVANLMDAADLFILTSTSEALPLCTMEAMAKGVPVIASSVGGIPEQLGETGKLVPNPAIDPAGAIAQVMDTLVRWSAHAAQRVATGEAGRARAATLFREEDMLSQTLAVIAGALSTPNVGRAPETGRSEPSMVPTSTESVGSYSNLIDHAQALLREGKLADAAGALERAAMLAPTASGAEKARALAAELRASVPGPAPSAAVPLGPASTSFGAPELAAVEKLVKEHEANPADAPLVAELRGWRDRVAAFVRSLEPAEIARQFGGDFDKLFRVLARSGLVSEPLAAEEDRMVEAFTQAIHAGVDSSTAFDVRLLLVHMLYVPAHVARLPLSFTGIPDSCLGAYLDYLVQPPSILARPGEAEAYREHLERLTEAVLHLIQNRKLATLTRTVATTVGIKLNLIPAYDSSVNTAKLMKNRAAILEFILVTAGAQLDFTPRSRPIRGRKIRVGFLNAHFSEQTETHVTLPTLRLDRERFEIHLFPLAARSTPIEAYCRSLADRFVPLPRDIGPQVKTIRDAGLDVLIIGTNITAVTNGVALLAAHRLAPIQVVSYCSPMTTGMRHVDGYLFGTLSEFPGVDAHFTEKLVMIEGAPGCLDYAHEKPGTMRFERKSLGIADDDVVFINAASCFKIPLELLETWARVLATVPKSRLLLLPFNPNWSSAFPAHKFKALVESVFARHGLSPDRVILVRSLPSRADVKALERIADVYLDTFPFSGSLSVVDPLELGLPTIVSQGNTPRSRAAAALLKAIGVTELIADDVESYIATAASLGGNPTRRAEIRAKLERQMASKPPFLDPHRYGRELSAALEALVAGKPARALQSEAAVPCA